MTEDDIGNYTCVAKNVVGMSKAVTEVILLGEHHTSFITEDQVTLATFNVALTTLKT